MSTSAVNSTSLRQELQQYFQTRQSDLKQLGQALNSGDLAGAQSAFSAITALGKNGPFAGGNPFQISQREQAFAAVGQALQSGNLAVAKQAFGALKGSFEGGRAEPLPANANSAPITSGPEIVLNLSNNGGSATPEPITINIANAGAGGGEQVSLSIGNQGSSAQQVTFNLPANSNEQIVLNLLGGSPSSSTGTASNSTPSSAGISVSA